MVLEVLSGGGDGLTLCFPDCAKFCSNILALKPASETLDSLGNDLFDLHRSRGMDCE